MLINLLYIDRVSILMLVVISVVGISVVSFSKRYLEGDALYNKFFLNLTLLIISVSLMAISDHLALFLIFWAMSNRFLLWLMIHKRSWDASAKSGLIAKKNFMFGFLMIFLGITTLAYTSETTSIHKIINSQYDQNTLRLSLLCLFIGAMAQSAIWPFHKWLTSSLNSPTPVSAIMHAGLVNGGGYILARFSPLYVRLPHILELIFLIGLFTAIIGTLWKLIQADIKRMLACSTMSQMGFMMMQCGLGLFPAALAHLCFHSFFKAYLFLASSSAAAEKQLNWYCPPKFSICIISILCGFLGSITFAFMSHQSIAVLDTNLILLMIVFVVGMQFSLTILTNSTSKKMFFAISGVICFSGFYGLCIYTAENFLEPLNLMQPQPLTLVHITGGLLLCSIWAVMLFTNNFQKQLNSSAFMQKCYVLMLNLSQPSSKTITPHRSNYRYT